MENRTFLAPDVRFDSEIEFCTPSWKRRRKYLSWHHWLATRSLVGKSTNIEKTIRYKLYEIGFHAGAVILDVGLSPDNDTLVALRAANDAGIEPQYFGVESEIPSLVSAHRKFQRRRLDEQAVFFRGSLFEFRNTLPITPTMVVVNVRDNIECVLKHLALFLADRTPVLVSNWFESRADDRSIPRIEGFECWGRFGESVLLQSSTQIDEQPASFSKFEFEKIRGQFCVDANARLVQNREAARALLKSENSTVDEPGKQWPYLRNNIQYPATLPDGTPWPKISIVTPTYNQGQYIEQTINSVLNQGYPNLEYIVVDGGSTDQTSQILTGYSHHFAELISEPDEGQSDAINKGMKLATGEILTWLNSDDLLTEGALHAMAMAFWKSKADMVVGAIQLMRDGEVVAEHLTSCPNGPLDLSELLMLDENWLQGRFFYQPEVMFTRDLWERAGGYVDKKLYYSMDHELWLRFAIAGANMHVIGRPTAMYRMHEQQKTNDDYQPELRTVNRRYVEKFGPPDHGVNELESRHYRVTLVNDVGTRYGAGIAHGRLREAFEAAGHETTMVCSRPDDEQRPKTEATVYAEIEKSHPDLVVFGNLHNAELGMSLVDDVSERWPTCFVMHDLWLATGRCCYLNSCEKFKTSCDFRCPTPNEYPAMNPEKIESTFMHKLNVISKPRKVVMLANSEWTRGIAEASAITSKGVVKTLKYGFPTQIFKPRDKAMCREILGLPQDDFIVLFASINVSEERKGLSHLFEALNRLQLKNLLPVCIGYSYDHTELYPGTVTMGYVDDPWRAAMIYSAADVFVGPSLQEAFGQIFIEAAACGTPSVAYPVGGVKSAIEHGITGLLASHVHPAALADEIRRLYSDAEYRQNLGSWGRIEIENEWSLRSAYHRFNNVLREVPEHIGFKPPANIRFLPEKTGVVGKSSGGRTFGLLEKGDNTILIGAGFSVPEKLQLRDGTESVVRWAVGNHCDLHVRVNEAGPRTIRLRCLNPVQDQYVDVFCNEHHFGTVPVDTRPDFLEPVDITLASGVGQGDYHFRLEFLKTIKEQNGSRDLAMLFLNVEVSADNESENGVAAAA